MILQLFPVRETGIRAPGPCLEQPKEFVAVRLFLRRLAEEHDLELTLCGEGIERADESVLIFAHADRADAKNDRRRMRIRPGVNGKKLSVCRVGHQPRPPGKAGDRLTSIVRDANDSAGARQRETFEPRGDPGVQERRGVFDAGDEAHVAVDRQHIRPAREDGAQRAIAFGALAMDEIRLEFPQFFSDRADATLIEGFQPAAFRHVQAVKPDVVRDFLLRLHRVLGAGNHMRFEVRHAREALQQCVRRGAERGDGVRVILDVFPDVGGQEGKLHCVGRRGGPLRPAPGKDQVAVMISGRAALFAAQYSCG